MLVQSFALDMSVRSSSGFCSSPILQSYVRFLELDFHSQIVVVSILSPQTQGLGDPSVETFVMKSTAGTFIKHFCHISRDCLMSLSLWM